MCREMGMGRKRRGKGSHSRAGRRPRPSIEGFPPSVLAASCRSIIERALALENKPINSLHSHPRHPKRVAQFSQPLACKSPHLPMTPSGSVSLQGSESTPTPVSRERPSTPQRVFTAPFLAEYEGLWIQDRKSKVHFPERLVGDGSLTATPQSAADFSVSSASTTESHKISMSGTSYLVPGTGTVRRNGGTSEVMTLGTKIQDTRIVTVPRTRNFRQ